VAVTPRSKRGPVFKIAFLTGLVILVALIHLNVGSTFWYTPWGVLQEIVRGPGAGGTRNFVVWTLRMPRAISCVMVGGVLGMVGSAFQAQFRNPLADPYIVGVSSGAAIGGVLAFLTGASAILGGFDRAVFGFVGGMSALGLVLALSRRRGVVDISSVLLSGVVIGSFLSAVLSMALLMTDHNSNEVLGWLLGRVTDVLPPQTGLLAVVLLAGAFVLVRETRRLNALALGEDTATRLGVDVNRLRNVVLITGTAMTAVAVGMVGIVGFLGLVAPHIARRLVGVDWRWSLIASGLVGAALLVVSDLIAQRGLSMLTGATGAEIPVGIVTAILGTPSLLILLRKQG